MIKDVTSSTQDIEYYGLTQVPFESKNLIYIPKFLKKIPSDMENNVLQYEYFDENSGYLISINKMKSRNTEVLSDREYIKYFNKFFRDELKGDLKEVERILPPIMENVRVVDIESNLKINDKFFLKRISYYNDKRLNGTTFEGINCLNFQFVTINDKSKYYLDITYYGDEKSLSNLVGLFNTIGGSIKYN
jgi:hypothetical protein